MSNHTEQEEYHNQSAIVSDVILLFRFHINRLISYFLLLLVMPGPAVPTHQLASALIPESTKQDRVLRPWYRPAVVTDLLFAGSK